MGPRPHEHFEVNGTVYRSLDEVPEQFRDSIAALIADRDGNGVPDIMEGTSNSGSGSFSMSTHHETYEVDGVTYDSIDEVPEPVRSQLRQALPNRTIPPAPSAPAATPRVAIATNALITDSGMSKRSRLLIGFFMVDVAIVALVIWLVVR